MKPKARLIIPFWGVSYTHKVIELTLPALLAPGNIPALCEDFELELCLVAETNMFDVLRASEAYAACAALCEVILEPIDDLLTGVAGDYGPVLTFALFKGFIGLKERMLDYYLLFLCADFVVADGSYRTVARLMKEGKQVIHLPSFRAVSEDTLPLIQAKVDKVSGVLAMTPREMADMALKHRHMTVKARTVNQKLCHQSRMDQFYWYVDEFTLVGYQWPVALAALKPQVVVERPALMFDYGFIPEICPTAEYYFIPDSDQGFMLEMQHRFAGEDMMRIGWISDEDMIKDLNMWTTREHRICGQEPHIFHARELPPSTGDVIKKSKAYMASLVARLAPPNPHQGHPLFKTWWSGVLSRMPDAPVTDIPVPAPVVIRQPTALEVWKSLGSQVCALMRKKLSSVLRTLIGHAVFAAKRALGPVYIQVFGKLPLVKPCHPYWLDTRSVIDIIQQVSPGANIMHVGDGESFFSTLLPKHIEVAAIKLDMLHHVMDNRLETVDFCFCDMRIDQVEDFSATYAKLRPLVKEGGEIYLYVLRGERRLLSVQDIGFINNALPQLDISTAYFFGTAETRRLRSIITGRLGAMFRFPNLRILVYGVVMVVLTPFMWQANRRGIARDTTIFTPDWTSMLLKFEVRRGGGAQIEGEGHVG
ncbi:MAG: hypothetical protein WCK65_04795 [Rhodospirillaceae bacterium]